MRTPKTANSPAKPMSLISGASVSGRGLVSREPCAILRTDGGDVVPLKSVIATGRLDGLLFELAVEQRYHNASNHNLEAVFTFPLPLRAVLLGFDLEIGERKFESLSVRKQQASEQYERAIDEGNTAALIDDDGNGLYTVSLGHLMAGESAVIRYRYADILDAHDGRVRLNVPTAIAPRYGSPSDAGLEGPTIPGTDLLCEYPFEIRLDLAGLSDRSGIRSHSHTIKSTTGPTGITVTLARTGFLDRDFVLEIDHAAMPREALLTPDGDDYVVLANATLGLEKAEQRPLALKVLLDCSGSMSGDSIAAAKRALCAILERLTDEDCISLTRFGSTFQHVTEGLEAAAEDTLALLKTLVRAMDADLGGTEMAEALSATLDVTVPQDRTPDVILITDGEIYDIEDVVGLAARSGHRIFAISIGAAPVEALARTLAEQTGGAGDFVNAGEDAEAAILRTFKRLRSTPRTLAAVDWPMEPAWTIPPPAAAFPGDTLHLIAGFRAPPTGAVTITVRDAAGQSTAIHVPIATRLTTSSLLARLAAARRLSALPEEEGILLAVKYQLASKHTSFVVVAERAEGEKAEALPTTVAVPHMLAAGWGGTAHLISPDFAIMSCRADVAAMSSGSTENLRKDELIERLYAMSALEPPSAIFPRADREALLRSLAAAYQSGKPIPTTFEELWRDHSVSMGVIEVLWHRRNMAIENEADIVGAFLALLATDESAIDLDQQFLTILAGTVRGSRKLRKLRYSIHSWLFT